MNARPTVEELTALTVQLNQLFIKCMRDRDTLLRYVGELANDLHRETNRNVACHLLALRLARLGDPADPGGVTDRVTVTLTQLINQANAALAGEYLDPGASHEEEPCG